MKAIHIGLVFGVGYIYAIFPVNAVLVFFILLNILWMLPNLSFKTTDLVMLVIFMLLIVYSFASENDNNAIIRNTAAIISIYLIYSNINQRDYTNINSNQIIFKLVSICSILFILKFLFTAFTSESYQFLVNIDRENRANLGIYPLLHCLLIIKNRKFSLMNSLIVLVVPILAVLNGSRSELLFFLISFVLIFRQTSVIFAFTSFFALFLVLFATFNQNFEIYNNIADISGANTIATISQLEQVGNYYAYNNWRVYESFLQIREINQFDYYEYIIGCGLGCNVETPVPLYLGDTRYTSLDSFHNGYFALFMYLGIFSSVIIYHLFKTLFISFKHFEDNIVYQVIFLTTLFFILTATTSGGYLNLMYVATILPILIFIKKNA